MQKNANRLSILLRVRKALIEPRNFVSPILKFSDCGALRRREVFEFAVAVAVAVENELKDDNVFEKDGDLKNGESLLRKNLH